jgi:hypothetical protein
MMMTITAVAIIIKIIINVRWPSGGPICTFCFTHMITCCCTETRSINTARASSVWRKCPGSWCLRLTHVWRGKIMTTVCVSNNARGRAILVERLLLVDTAISWFDFPLCWCRLKCHPMWISLYDFFANSKSAQSEFLLRNCIMGLSGQMSGWEGQTHRCTRLQVGT